ncbi:MAG: flagellar hook basal-body protein [Nitrospiraceae bacterium]|nr:flagellar hook basal-body protein [Nitrospiraceae bacterium]
MYKGIYIALSGAVLKQLQMDTISNNLSNVNTPGFKKENMSFKDYLVNSPATDPEEEERDMSTLSAEKTDFSEGNIFKTSNSMDLCVEGQGFIALEGNRYTRRGDLKLTGDGFLTTANGIKVLGEKGPVKLTADQMQGSIKIDTGGNMYVDGEQVDSLKLVDFPDNAAVVKMGSGIYYWKGAVVKSDAAVKQGYLEASNVDVINEMVRMIDALREYETYQKAIQTFDEAASKVTGSMATL